jgi:hypothetical protein
MNDVDHWWNDTGRGKPLPVTLSPPRIWPGIEPGPLR